MLRVTLKEMIFLMDKNKKLFFYLLIFAVFVFLSVFVLPFYIARKTPAVSTSYDYQFNNLISVIALCFSVFIGSIIFYKYFDKELPRFSIDNLFRQNIDAGLNIKNAHALFFIHSFAILCLYLLNANYGYGEQNYFLLRIDRLSLGQEPYKDFEYAYGILLIYLPKLITDLFHFPTSVNGYFISLTVLNAIGIYFLYYVINSFNIDRRKKVIIFFSVGLACIPLSLGMNYILLRFITPVASIFLLGEIIRKLESASLKNCILIALAAVAVSLLNFIISIEVGIAVLLSILGYLFFSVVLNKKTFHLITLLVCGVLITLILLLLGKSSALIIKVFAAGGNNWVVIPAPSIVLFIVSFLITNFIFCSWIIKKNISFLTCALLIFNMIMLAGAFGRCDPGHIFWYGLSSLITAWVITALISNKYFTMYSIAFISIFLIGMNASGLYLYKSELSTLVARYLIHNGKANSLREFAQTIHYDTTIINRYAEAVTDRVDYKELSKYQKIALPFDVDKDIYLFLLKSHIYSPEYYTGYFLNTFTPDQINTKLKGLKDNNHKYMVIPENVLNFSYSSDIIGERKFISRLFLFPYHYTKVRDSQRLYEPVYAYIHNNYKPVKTIKKGFILVERI